MKKLSLALLALTLAAPMAPAQTLTVTGNNGGTVQSSRDCARNPGSANCTTTTTATTANGQTATKQRTRVSGNGSSETTVLRSGPNGESNTRTRRLTFGN